MKDIILYSPKGENSIIPHPTKVEEMIAKGWVKKKPTVKKKSTQEKKDGKS